MLDQAMCVTHGGERIGVSLHMGCTERVAMAFQFWMAELSRDVLRLGVHFRAVGVLLQVPGGAAFEYADDTFENESERLDLIGASDRDELLNVLADCFKRLGAADGLIAQVAGPNFKAYEPSEPWKKLLDKRAAVENGLLTLTAECLESLVIVPGMAEIHEADEPHWWHRWPMP